MKFKKKSDYTVIDKLIRACLENKLIVILLTIFIMIWGIWINPFDVNIPGVERSPIPVDAIPDIGENQQIVFTEWRGRSPKDIEDQITYPLTISLQGIPGIKTIRSYSYFGFSSIYVVFKEDIEFYWSRSRILEKLNSASKQLPEAVTPILGPDATGLGQIFWYTVEGEGFSLQELRTIQDWYVRYSLQSAEGVSEVSSIGGFVKEYQIDVDPEKLRVYNIPIQHVPMAVKNANIDIGAKSIDINSVEYVIRGLGFIKTLEDIENVVLKEVNNVPIKIKDIAHVSLGPAIRRGVLDKEGAEVVGGVVVSRYLENPLKVIKNVKKAIKEITPGLPQKILEDGRISKVKIVPFYDRSILIQETLDTLYTALSEEIMITVIVILIMLMNLRVSFLVSLMLPSSVLITFVLMNIMEVDSNIMSLSGIAIAIGTMVDMGIIVSENITKKIKEASLDDPPIEIVFEAVSEIGGAILTAILTTVVSFLPVFTMTGAEGKLFTPLAWTKTFALLGSVLVALTILPIIAQIILFKRKKTFAYPNILSLLLLIVSILFAIKINLLVGILLSITFLHKILSPHYAKEFRNKITKYINYLIIGTAAIILTISWRPLSYDVSLMENFLFVLFIFLVIIGFFLIFYKYYKRMLVYFLNHKQVFMIIPLSVLFLGLMAWLGFQKMTFIILLFLVVAFGYQWSKRKNLLGSVLLSLVAILFLWQLLSISTLPPKYRLQANSLYVSLSHAVPGMEKEFMPNLDEGSFLYMPTTMPHSSISENMEVLSLLDKRLKMIPEVDSVVGKIGRVDSPLDPAPISMIESIITYKTKYKIDKKTGKRVRQWREHIKTPDDIWDEIIKHASIPGLTSAPKLQPISTRIIMLQSGMRAPMGVKLKGPSLEAIEKAGFAIEKKLKFVEGVEPSTVFADRVVGKPYLEIKPDRNKLAIYGINVNDFLKIISISVSGTSITKTVEGRETYHVRVRYSREKRDSIEALKEIFIPVSMDLQIPLEQLASITYRPGPMVIKSEDTFLTSYVLFDKKKGHGEVDVVEKAKAFLDSEIKSGKLILPKGVNFVFAGNYENQVRSQKTLILVIPIALFIIFMILYMQFKSPPITIFIFSGIFIALCGGMIFIFLYSQEWFMNFPFFGESLRELFNIRQFNLSVAVWIGFLALFGLASDDGVVMATYLEKLYKKNQPQNINELRKTIVTAGEHRVLPCIMTTATTLIALIPVMTSKGRGSDVMIPMAMPLFGGMLFEVITMFVVPILYSWHKEKKFQEPRENRFKIMERSLTKTLTQLLSSKVNNITKAIYKKR